jgi:CBS domain-containing protein
MGFFGTLLGFGAGYVTGMKLGDKPVRMVRKTTQQLRGQAGGASRIDIRTMREVMSSSLETITPDGTLAEAAKQMSRADIGDVLVVDETGLLRGIVTDRDIAIRAVAEGLDPRDTPVVDVMSSAVTISATASVAEAMQIMRRHDIRRLPVLEDGQPVGIVSLGDLSASSEAGPLLADISAAPPDR